MLVGRQLATIGGGGAHSFRWPAIILNGKEVIDKWQSGVFGDKASIASAYDVGDTVRPST